MRIFGVVSLFVLSAVLLIKDISASAYLGYCKGKFALCSASVCKLTGRNITFTGLKGETTKPEVSCTCPVMESSYIAAFNSGKMGDTCAPPKKNTVWSLYSTIGYIPQKKNNWSMKPEKSSVNVVKCSDEKVPGRKKIFQFAQCGGFLCTKTRVTKNGVQLAECLCPLESFAETLIQGNGIDHSACSTIAVGIPIIDP